jgi:uncharacterized damage-inducible protein DinB
VQDSQIEALKYPIGPCSYPPTSTTEERRTWIANVAETPANLRAAVAGLTAAQLDTPYRPGGWTVRQVVHHVPDSHVNAYVRFKLALTEDVPVIKPYDESAWATLPDATSTPIEVSLDLLEALHDRWVRLLSAMSDAEFARQFRHPEIGTMSLGTYLAGYSWHGKHHVAHITRLRERMGWTR